MWIVLVNIEVRQNLVLLLESLLIQYGWDTDCEQMYQGKALEVGLPNDGQSDAKINQLESSVMKQRQERERSIHSKQSEIPIQNRKPNAKCKNHFVFV